jgi:hypothetical protein
LCIVRVGLNIGEYNDSILLISLAIERLGTEYQKNTHQSKNSFHKSVSLFV